jgi:hypothetical protein
MPQELRGGGEEAIGYFLFSISHFRFDWNHSLKIFVSFPKLKMTNTKLKMTDDFFLRFNDVAS